MPLINALTIVYRAVQLLIGYPQRHGLHGQEHQGGPKTPSVPEDGDQGAVRHVFRRFSVDIFIILLQLFSLKIWNC